jgi:hypothetical protein
MSLKRFRIQAALILGLLLAVAAVVWTSPHRGAAPGLLEGERISVSNSNDSGPGSLREALFAVARSKDRVHVIMHTERVALENPLPPIINPQGVVLESASRTVIDGEKLRGGAVLDFQTDNVEIDNVAVEHASDVAIMLRGRNATLRALSVTGAPVGVEILTTAMNLSIRDSTFGRDGIAIKAQAAPDGVIDGNHFSGNQESAVWIVAARFDKADTRHELHISNNDFHGDRDAVVLGNMATRLELNKFSDISGNAIAILDGRTVIHANSFQRVHGTSVLLDSSQAVEVSDNDIAGGAGIGIMAKSVVAGTITRNRLFGNAYGVVQVGGTPGTPLTWEQNMLLNQHADGLQVIGASPLLRSNRALNNQGAGIRVLSLLDAQGNRTEAAPLLEGNIATGNGTNEVVRGDYHL